MTPAIFKFKHDVQSNASIDARLDAFSKMPFDHLHFAGFKVQLGTACHYFHALLAAEDESSLVAVIQQEREHIQRYYTDVDLNQITMVFYRCLAIQHPDLMSPQERRCLNDCVQQKLQFEDDQHFVVTGLQGESRLGWIDIDAADALTAIQIARVTSLGSTGMALQQLEVCQAHPVTAELSALYYKTVNQLFQRIGIDSLRAADIEAPELTH